ncbi:MAG: SDR family NAD(P)-dependent oxidoreductase [Solirubrobacterales bacterium]
MSSERLAGKRVIVTGAAQGLGREFALHLADLGARVLASDVREDGLAETCDLAGGRAGELRSATADVSSPEQTLALADAVRDAFGGVDALVNNAAIIAGLRRCPFDEIPEQEWDRVLSVNAKGPWLCARAVVPLMREGGGGSIVNLSSEVAFSGSPELAHYVASKGAVIGLTRALATELGPLGVRVNAIAPGFIDTSASRGLLGGRTYDASMTPLRRVGQPEDLLGALTFLLSDESAFVTGQTLLVNGGRLKQ